MEPLVGYEVHDGVAALTVRNPPVNALSPGVPEGVTRGIERAEADPAAVAIVLIGGGDTFIAGADIREFIKFTSGEKERGPALTVLLAALEGAKKPTVAALHGTALGGGLEVAQACHYRVALASTLLGQPEVKLGIIPGAGGTQRLPRLAGVAKAVEMCALGEPIGAVEARACGLVDAIVEGSSQQELLEGAMAFARERAIEGAVPPRTSERGAKLGTPRENARIFEQARAVARSKRRGQLAPLKAVEAVEAATELSFADGVRREAAIFEQCLHSDQSKALIHAFFAEREVRKIPDVPKDAPTREIRRAAVAGAGTMGGGIAMAYADAGLPVLLKDASAETLQRGMAAIRANYDRSVARGRISREEADRRLARIEPRLDYDGFEDADIVVEAVFEGMELKKRVFAELDAVARPGAILASNTSTLDIDAIASATKRPADVIGHHFFSPANVMKLLEIVRGRETARDVIATSMQLAKRLRKVGVLVGNCRGFAGNRMFGPYRREAQFLVEEGADIAQVDEALYQFGMAMGPLAVGDLAGLDVGWRIRKEYAHLEPEGARRPLAEDRLCEQGRFGQKTGAGWYRYDGRERFEDPEAERIVRAAAAEAGVEQHKIDEQEIVDRCVLALVNEGASILAEGYALRAGDIDVVYLYGYGFPAYRGGPMWYADTIGLVNVLDRIRALERRHGHWWRPAPLLVELAEARKTFAQWDRERR
ncbi:MAG: enoyl-CoA hydratase/isomerase family protein [Bryobacterales bacterium]|nr:enoyl-CoA hydratase/isomerase family protein [Bryobacterales bacterium]